MDTKQLFMKINLLILIAIVGCNSLKKESNPECVELSYEFIKTSFLGKKVNELPLLNCLKFKDSIITGDEGETWRAKEYYSKDKLIFYIESNWQNKDLVSRITIVDSLVNDKIKVGKSFKDIKKYIAKNIPSVSDGYLILDYENDKSIHIQLDISNYSDTSKLFYGIKSLNEIPNDLLVQSIIIME